MGRNQDRPDHVALLICKGFLSSLIYSTSRLASKVWESCEKRSPHLRDMKLLAEKFASGPNSVIESSPKRLFCGNPSAWTTRDMCTEIVTFYIPVKSSEKSMVELMKDLFKAA